MSEPLVVASYCHCKRCQRRSGTAASASAHPAPGTFQIVAGEDRLRVWKPDGGGEKWFCGDCGSSCSAATPTTPIPSASGWERSIVIRGSGRASASSSPMPRHGSRSPTTDCPVTRKAAISTLTRGRRPLEPGWRWGISYDSASCLATRLTCKGHPHLLAARYAGTRAGRLDRQSARRCEGVSADRAWTTRFRDVRDLGRHGGRGASRAHSGAGGR